MDMERYVCPDPDSQRTFDTQQMANWVNWLAPWQVMSTLTFSWECSLDSARRVFERFMTRHLSRVSYMYGIEANPSRDGFHVHSLWADCSSVFRREAWASWFGRYGRAVIEPVRSQEDASAYASKYIIKKPCWWNVRLQWHRIEAMHNREFKLRDNDIFGAGFIRRELQQVSSTSAEPELSRPQFTDSEVKWFQAGPGLWEVYV
jgi:hypothetical protein